MCNLEHPLPCLNIVSMSEFCTDNYSKGNELLRSITLRTTSGRPAAADKSSYYKIIASCLCQSVSTWKRPLCRKRTNDDRPVVGSIQYLRACYEFTELFSKAVAAWAGKHLLSTLKQPNEALERFSRINKQTCHWGTFRTSPLVEFIIIIIIIMKNFQ